MSRFDWPKVGVNALAIFGGTLFLSSVAMWVGIEYTMLTAAICAAIPSVTVIAWRNHQESQERPQPRHGRAG